jgi:hypothetical protein
MRSPERGTVIKTTIEKENLPIKVVQLDVTDDD